MPSEVADLFVTLRAHTAPFTRSMAEATAQGESFSKKMGGWQSAMTKFGLAGTAAGVAIAAISVKMAGDFQASMVRLKTSAGETGDLLGGKLTGNLKVVSDGILKMAVDTATGTKELAAGMYMVESAGFHGAGGLKILQAAAEGAKAEGAPLHEVGNALTTMLKDFHLGAKNAVPAMNQLIATVAHGKTTMGELASALHSVLPIGAAAHLSYAQIGGAIATMTSHGVTAELATQHLSNAIKNLIAPNTVAAKEMNMWGLSAVDVAHHVGDLEKGGRGLTGTLDLLTGAVLKHSHAGLAMIPVFNQSRDAASSANAMLKSMPRSLQGLAEAFLHGKVKASDYSKSLKALPQNLQVMGSQFKTAVTKSSGFSDALKKNQGAAETVNKALLKMTGGAVGLETALQLTGKNAIDFKNNVSAIGDAAKKTGAHVENWALIQHTFNFQLSKLKEQVETAAIKLGTMLLPAVTKIVSFLAGHSGVLKAFAVVLGVAFVLALVAATIAVWNFNAALLANPVTWIILAIVAAVALLVAAFMWLWNNCKVFRDGLKAIWAGIKLAFKAAWDAISAVIHWFVSNVLPGLKQAWHNTWNALKQAWQAFQNGPGKDIKKLAAEIADWWRAHSAQIKAVVRVTWREISSAFKTAVNVINTVVKPWLAGMKIAFDVTWSVIKNYVKTAWHFIYNIIKTAAHLIMNSITLALDIITGKWGKVWGDLNKLCGQALHDVVKTIKDVGSDFGKLLYDAGKALIDGLIKGIQAAEGWLWDKVKSIGDGVKNAFHGAFEINSPSKVTERVGDSLGEGLVNGLNRSAKKSVAAAKRHAAAVKKQMETLHKQLVSFFKKEDLTVGLAGAADKIKETIKKLNTEVLYAWRRGGISTSKASHLLTVIRDDNTKLEGLAKARQKILDTIAAAKAFRADTKSNAIGFANITGLGETSSSTDMAGKLREKLLALKDFAKNIAKLAKTGLNKTSLRQLIEAGPEAAAQMAGELANGPAAMLKSINDTQAQINAVAGQLGTTGADALYGKTSALQSQANAITKLMKHAADQLVKALEHALGVKGKTHHSHTHLARAVSSKAKAKAKLAKAHGNAHDRPIHLDVKVHLDGKEIYANTQKHALRTAKRNPTNGLTPR